MMKRKPFVAGALLILAACGGGAPVTDRAADHAADRDAEVAALLAIHQTIMTAHLEGKIEPWMATAVTNNGRPAAVSSSPRAASGPEFRAASV